MTTTSLPASDEIVNQMVRIDQLFPHPRNYNLHSEDQKQRLRASVARWAQVRSIVVQAGAPGRYMIVAGHGFVEAARDEGLTELRADVIPASWSDAQISGYLVADNELARMSAPDGAALAGLLQEQQHADYALEALGSSDAEFADLMETLADAQVRAGTDAGADGGSGGAGDDPDDDAVAGVDDPGKAYRHQFAVAIVCADEAEQQSVYEKLTAEGYTCRVLVV